VVNGAPLQCNDNLLWTIRSWKPLNTIMGQPLAVLRTTLFPHRSQMWALGHDVGSHSRDMLDNDNNNNNVAFIINFDHGFLDPQGYCITSQREHFLVWPYWGQLWICGDTFTDSTKVEGTTIAPKNLIKLHIKDNNIK
jgi:hypothetical protein